MPQRARATTPPTDTAVKSGTAKSTTTEALDRLAETARAEHRAIINLEGQALDHAIKAGEALHEIKLLTHSAGESWSLWTSTHLKISKQQADTYIRVYQGRDKLTELRPEHKSIRRAADVLAGRADKYGLLLHKPPKEETGAAEQPVADEEDPVAGEGDEETPGRIKLIKADPSKLLLLAKREGLKAKITEIGLIDLINVLLEEVGAGVLLTTAEDEEAGE